MVSNLSGSEETLSGEPAPTLHASISGSGAPVVLLHGLFGMGSNLGVLARALAEDYEVHQLDLPNHGRSPWTDAMGLGDLADAVAAYIRNLAAPVRLMGHSLGGKVAMQLALSHGELVSALVIADIAPVAYPSTHDAVFSAIAEVSALKPASRGEAATLMKGWIAEEGVVQFLLLSLRRGSEGAYDWRFNAQALRSNYAAIREAPEGRSYSGPALFVHGALSDYVKPAGIEAAKHMFPRSYFESLEGTGHWLHVEKPAEFNAAVGSFLKGTDGERNT